ncbi:MAG: penicillin-binding transpeptidase domain-containing protein [Pseudomonadota bacterium]
MSGWRHYSVLVLFVAAVLGLCGRVVYLSVTERDFLQQQGDMRSVRTESIPAMRGVIYDRQGEPLAVSTPVFAVWTDPSKAHFDAAALSRLAAQLELPLATLEERLAAHADKEFVYLKRRASWQMAQSLKDLGLDHIYLQPEYRRYYPAAETTAHLVGVTNIDDQGIEGSEKAFEQALHGEHGSKVVLKDRRGSTIRDIEYLGPAVYGQDLVLSIDLRLQYIAYRELKSAVRSHGAESGSLVMLDARSGEILALVNQPSYNPNDVRRHMSGMRNRAVTDIYEPGSTIKPFTALAALESGRYSAGSRIDTAPGYFTVGRKLIQDPVNRETITLAEAIAVSSQVAIAKVALDLEERAVFDVLTRAGVGEYVGSGLPGEAVGFFDGSQLRYPVVRTSLSYGYGLSLSPLQLAQAYLALGSLGRRLPVTLLKVEQPVRGQRVFDESVARQVLGMMEKVTHAKGTAPGAAVRGYRIAGKTGTARVVGPQGYDDERHVALFAGVAPVTEPRVVMVVVVNEPRAGLSGGGAVAAPVFGRVAQRSLRLLGVAPDADTEALADAGADTLAIGGARG